MRDLAKLANVSVSTVSKAFCNARDINPETKEHILNLAKEYGCYGKFYKGKYSKKIIAIICPEIISGYYSNIIDILQKKIEESNCMVIISSDHFDKKIQAELIEYYCSYLRVDGIIVSNLNVVLKKSYETPIVALSHSHDASVDTVNIVLDFAIKEAFKTLKSYGHKNIAFLGEKLTVDKAKKFIEFAKEEHIRYEIIESPYRFEKAGEDGVEKLFSKTNDCTAAICAYDNIAFGAIRKLKKMGIRVPEDFSVIGFDNNKVSSYTETSLTTIDLNSEKVCDIAWKLLQKKIKNNYYKSDIDMTVDCDLIIRESIAENTEKDD